ncbi:hypothetical protein FHS61_000267 [Altererythrobacter atlanticus]|uniref:Uncharacterized protein n=1 Tax=Croceibacterium atlanticum TaxID=1267766 RepID=A0A0F7KTD8_9SPHN|nr:hypothetical protein [Croceibacterium atlanticum]AKH42497.1 hypothetical protein WYH_01457 [Croceibacterium atlanticum]MBB5731274.1 hypothetical protein [Croceibacterium atlanticum]
MNHLAEDFWNFRGTFRIAKILDVGTHMSLIRRANGRFLMIDSYSLKGSDRRELLALTDNGRAIEAILNVHPFHTLHCRSAHELAPHARLIGTRRHRDKAPELPWETGLIEDPSTQAEFAEDVDFSVPAGVDFISTDESVHVSSVLVRHRRSGIVHVDDTLNVFAAPGLLKPLFPQSRLRFHPMLAKALEPTLTAADEFAGWARKLAEDWAGTPIVCAAHSAIRHLQPDGWREEVLRALSDVEKTLGEHRANNG